MPERSWEFGNLKLTRRGLLLTGLLAAGCGGPRRPTIKDLDSRDYSDSDPERKRLEEILQRRAKAVLDKDEQAYLADLDQSNAELIDRERMVFANLRQFELSEFRYITERIWHDPNDQPVFGPVIRVARLSVDATEAGVFPAEAFRYTLGQKDGKLVVTEIEPATPETTEDATLGPLLAKEPWNFTPLQVIQAGNVWLAADRSVSDLKRYADLAESEARWVEKLWGDRLRFPGHLLFFTRDPEAFKAWYYFGSAANFMEDIEGFQHSANGVRKNGEIYANQFAGARIVVNLQNVKTFSNGDPQAVLRHELVHAVTARARATPSTSFSGLGSPTWAVEGFATWATSLERPADRSHERAWVARGVSRKMFTGEPPRSTEFYSASAEQRYFNYVVSASIFSYVAQLQGREAAVEFYEQVIRHNDQEGTPFHQLPAFDGICQRVVGKSGGAFLEQWARFVRNGA